MTMQYLAYKKRWSYDQHRGIDRSPVPATEVADHVDKLCALGGNCAAIAQVAGVNAATVQNIRRRKYETSQRDVVAKILRVTIEQVRARQSGYLPRIGCTRRIQALLALGWRYEDITAVAGMRVDGVCTKNGRWVMIEMHTAVLHAYKQLSMTRGPSQSTRNRSARAGYLPPLAWDDDTLDNPDATPAPQHRLPGTPAAAIEDIEFVAAAGEPWDVAAHRLGTNRAALDRRLHRIGRHDLVARFTSNSEHWSLRDQKNDRWSA